MSVTISETTPIEQLINEAANRILYQYGHNLPNSFDGDMMKIVLAAAEKIHEVLSLRRRVVELEKQLSENYFNSIEIDH